MKYKVRIEGRTFEAEVGNVDARPIVVMIEGERFEVWPEAEGGRPGSAWPEAQGTGPEAGATRTQPGQAMATQAERPGREAGGTGVEAGPARARSTGPEAGRTGLAAAKVRAPIPGVIDSIAVRAGDAVGAGDPLCVIEAMKMKNVIRASRPGTIDDVLVAPGQHVHHNDVLLAFAE